MKHKLVELNRHVLTTIDPAGKEALFRKRHFRLLPSILFALLHTAVLVVLLLSIPVSSWAHGMAGERFFPSTLATDDPFVSDEFSLLFSHIKEPGEGDNPPTKTTEFPFEFSKRITPNLGISIGDSFRYLSPQGSKNVSGMSNMEVGLKYQFLTSAAHEVILSAGVSTEVGGTGAQRVGADTFSVLSPAFFFGKGFGDLPESLKYLKPFAITGVVGPNFPTRSKNISTTIDPDTGEISQNIDRNPTTLTWGFSIQYNLNYLQSFVRDIGLGAPFNRMIALVEFPLQTCVSRGCGGQVTGFVNPGLVWFGKSMQLGLEAQIPINDRTGKSVGVLGIVHFFIDDLFPKSIGRPIFP